MDDADGRNDIKCEGDDIEVGDKELSIMVKEKGRIEKVVCYRLPMADRAYRLERRQTDYTDTKKKQCSTQ